METEGIFLVVIEEIEASLKITSSYKTTFFLSLTTNNNQTPLRKKE